MNKRDYLDVTREFGVFDDLFWITSAIDKKVTRPAVKNIFIKEGWVVATDLKRIHAAYLGEDLPDCEDGLYQLIQRKRNHIFLKKDEDHGFSSYPDWEVIFPRSKSHEPFENIQLYKNVYAEFCRLVRKIPEDQALDFEFFKGLTDGTYDVIRYMDTGPIIFANCNRLAAVMPIRID